MEICPWESHIPRGRWPSREAGAMRGADAPRVRYSAAYPTDAPEKLCFGGKPHEVRPEGPQGAARERIVKVTPLPWGLTPLYSELDLYVSNASPMCVIENVEAGTSGKEEFVDICCKIENTGGSLAEKCRIVCEEILTLGADKKFSASDENKFRPLSFTWIGEKKTELDISVSDYGYFKLAEIRTRSSELGKAPDVGSTAGSLTPYLVVCLPSRTVKNQYIQFDDDKSIIIHFRMACVGGMAKERYVQIVWEGKSIADFRKHPEKLAVTDVTNTICSLSVKDFFNTISSYIVLSI